ncbi:MAG: hypothetical protein UHD64_10770, partial [Bacteroidales bacterium]|nr:hypothetical protein [Bacteroidales bacterium]
MNNKLPSEYISEFLNFIADAQSHYCFCFEQMKEQEQLTQDYLHSLELDGLKYDERSKLATKLAINRKDRRYYKDRVEELDPIINWASDPTTVKAINQLKQALGAVRKQEGYHKDRTYYPRV